MKGFQVKHYCILAMATLAILASPSYAAIQVAGTRIVFDGDQKEQTIRMTNTGDRPVLTQIWLDASEEEGEGAIRAGAQATPFIVNPPVARLNSNKAQVVRIFKTADVASLPQDHESVFWLNILEVPAKAAASAEQADPQAEANRLNIALRTRLKLFYRPTGLKGDTISAAEAMTWRIRKDGDDYVATCSNGSPFHVSFARLVLKQGEKRSEVPGGLARPASEAEFRFAGAATGSGPLTLDLEYITELGAFVPVSVPLPVER